MSLHFSEKKGERKAEQSGEEKKHLLGDAPEAKSG
jgi:hypothetical protein